MNSNQFKRWLSQHGCTFKPGKGGHFKVLRRDLRSVLPMHGSRDLGAGLVRAIKKDLGLENEE